MKKCLFLAALLCGTSFASFGTALTASDKLHTDNLQQKTDIDFSKTASFLDSRQKINYVFFDGFYQLSACGHDEGFYGSKEDAAELAKILVMRYC